MMRSSLPVVCGAICVGAQVQDNNDMIKKIQDTPGVLWQAGVTKFGAGVPMKPLLGVTEAGMEARRQHAAKNHTDLTDGLPLPESFDSIEHWPHCAKVIGDIRDQSMCGCCWAFAGAEAASDRLCISTNAAFLVPLSAEDVCFCAESDGCDGGMIDTPWHHMQFSKWFHKGGPGAVTGGQYEGTGPFGTGLCSDFSMPHCHHHGPRGNDPYPSEGTAGCPPQKSAQCPTKCDLTAIAPHNDFLKDKIGFQGDIISPSGENGIAAAILEGGPVETAFSVYMDFANYAGGIYHHVTGGYEGGHAVRMVGWGVENGQKYWKVANSWNPYWGENGYFRIRKGNNECGIEDMVTASSPKAKWGHKTTLFNEVVV